MKKLSEKASLFHDPHKLSWLIILFGMILMVGQYQFNRSIDSDEIKIMLNIIDRSFSGLLQPLDHAQGAPLGFLWGEKAITKIFGNNEYAFRLLPLIYGIASLFLFYKVAIHYLQPKAIPIALGLFAVCEPVIYYSSTVKQYSGDVCIALLLFYALASARSKSLTPPRIAGLGAVGAIAVWLSHPATFVLAGLGTSLALFCIMRKEWSKVRRLAVVCSIWLMSFTAFFLVSLNSLTRHQDLLGYWEGSFMPLPPTSFSDIIWFIMTPLKFFKFILGISFTKSLGVSLFHGGLFSSDFSALPLSNLALIGFVSLLTMIPGLFFLIGSASMLRGKREEFLLLSSPIFFALLASGLHKYPFSLRLILFAIPPVMLVIAEGAIYVKQKTEHKSKLLYAAALTLLFLYPLPAASYHLVKPRTFEEIKPVMSYLEEHIQDGDTLYLYYSSDTVFDYYATRYGFEKGDYILGIKSRRDWDKYREDLNKLRGNDRVWIVISHVCVWEGINEEELFIDHLDTIGIQLQSFKATGAAVYLYDLSE